MRAFIVGVLQVFVLTCFGSTVGAEQSSPEPTSELLISEVTEMRARINRELLADAARLSPEELSALKSRLIDQTDKLLEVAEGLENQFPSHTNLRVITEHAGFAMGLNAMLEGRCTNMLGTLSIHFASCAFESESELIREMAISAEQAAALQSLMESGLAAGVIAGLRYNPGSESAYQFLFSFARKARTEDRVAA